jgi:hypothetical protein
MEVQDYAHLPTYAIMDRIRLSDHMFPLHCRRLSGWVIRPFCVLLEGRARFEKVSQGYQPILADRRPGSLHRE